MTNEQTIIFLKSLRQRVEAAIEKTEAAMPGDAPREKRWRHKATRNGWPCLCMPSFSPDHWEEVDGAFVATAHLDKLLQSLDEDIDLLTEALKKSAA